MKQSEYTSNEEDQSYEDDFDSENEGPFSTAEQ